MSTGGPWYFGYCKDAAPDLEFAAVPIPKGTVESQSAYSGGLSIISQSKNKEAAMKFIKYALRDDEQINAITATGSVPSVTKLMPKYFENHKELEPIFANIEERGMPFAYPKETKNFNAELVKGIEEIVFKPGSKTVEDLLNELQQKFGTK